MDEMEHIAKDFEIEEFYDETDEFNANKRWAKELCEEIIKRRLNISWKAQMRADSMDDEQLLKLAKKQGRVLLTRDEQLYRRAKRKNLDVFFTEGQNEVERLTNLSKAFSFELEIKPDRSRCPRCNTKIYPVEKSEIQGKINYTTITHYEKFWRCPRCEKIYWQGAHWKKITETLQKAKKILTS